jgi:outer membrane protein assembly factor BamA
VLPVPLGDVTFIKQTLNASAYAPLLPHGRLTLGLQLNAGILMPISPVGRSLVGRAVAGGDGGGGGGGGAAAAAGGAGGGGSPHPESCISDRFFLGGPGSLWGFRTRGCGPREPRNSPLGDAPLAGATPLAGGAPQAGGALGGKAPCDALGGDVMAVGTCSLSVALPGKFEQTRTRAHVFASAGGLTGLAALNAAGSFAPSLRTCVGIGLAQPTSLGRVELNLTYVTRKLPSDAVVRNGIQFGIAAFNI